MRNDRKYSWAYKLVDNRINRARKYKCFYSFAHSLAPLISPGASSAKSICTDAISLRPIKISLTGSKTYFYNAKIDVIVFYPPVVKGVWDLVSEI